MKTLANLTNGRELVIVVKRGICTELIWTSLKNVANVLAKTVYSNKMGSSNCLSNTYLIDLNIDEIKELGLKRDSVEHTKFNTSKMVSWLNEHLIDENLYDIENIISENKFSSRHISLFFNKETGKHILVKTTRKLNEKLNEKLAETNYTLEKTTLFVENSILRLFAFMDITTGSKIAIYEISGKSLTEFNKYAKTVEVKAE